MRGNNEHVQNGPQSVRKQKQALSNKYSFIHPKMFTTKTNNLTPRPQITEAVLLGLSAQMLKGIKHSSHII